MGVAVLNTWYGYILRTKVIMVQKRPNYHPEVSKLLGIEMHTQLLSATLVLVIRFISVLIIFSQ